MATRKQLIEGAQKLFEDASVPVTRREIEWLLQEADSCSSIDLAAHADEAVNEFAENQFHAFVTRRLAREPVQYILGYTEFYGHRIGVNRSVLVPRPETELLVERVLAHLKDMPRAIVCDVGTGSGCIAISIKLALTETIVAGVDVSRRALETAASNAASLHADVVWLEGDLFDASLAIALTEYFGLGKIDVLVSNPPYVHRDEKPDLAQEIVRFEPEIALFTGVDALEPYRALAVLGMEVLTDSGLIVLEVHEDRAMGVERILTESGYVNVRTHKDLSGKDRMVTARINS